MKAPFNGFKSNIHHSYSRRIALVSTTILLVLLTLAAWCLYSMGQRAQKSAESLVRLEVRQYYVVSFNGKAAFYFTGFNPIFPCLCASNINFLP